MPKSSSQKKIIRSQIEESIAVKTRLTELTTEIASAAQMMTASLAKGGKILFCGNGGSAADAQHLAAELVVRLRSSFPRPAIPAVALTVDTSILTAAGNDYGFDLIFARQVEALGAAGDILIAISTSGNSGNIIQAVNAAQSRKMAVIAFVGGSGGALASMAELSLVAPSQNTARIQECHILIGHILCQLIEESLFPQS